VTADLAARDLPSVADHLLMVLHRNPGKALTYPRLAHQLYGTPVDPLGDAEHDTTRRSAIRTCQEAVARLRDAGEAICGGEDGMWLAQTSAEAFTEYRRLRSRALGQIRRASKMKATAFKMQQAESRVEQTSMGLVA
jgi:hypothetical protein